MNPFNLNVVQSIKRDFNTSVLFDPLSESLFVLSLNLNKFFLEVVIFSKCSEFADLIHVSNPFFNVSNSVRDESGKIRIAAMNPTSWSNSIRLVLDHAREVQIEILEDGVSQYLGVNGSNSVDCVRADDREESHPDLLLRAFFDKGHPRNLVIVSWVLGLQIFQEEEVHLVDQVKMSGKEFA
jgi:hypothetical protein